MVSQCGSRRRHGRRGRKAPAWGPMVVMWAVSGNTTGPEETSPPKGMNPVLWAPTTKPARPPTPYPFFQRVSDPLTLFCGAIFTTEPTLKFSTWLKFYYTTVSLRELVCYFWNSFFARGVIFLRPASVQYHKHVMCRCMEVHDNQGQDEGTS